MNYGRWQLAVLLVTATDVKNILVVLLILQPHYLSHPQNDDNKLRDGTAVRIESVPYLVRIYGLIKATRDTKFLNLYCGGSFITKMHILTAAHCVHLFKAEHMHVCVNQTNIVPNECNVRVASIVKHPQYQNMSDMLGAYNLSVDIAVLKTINYESPVHLKLPKMNWKLSALLREPCEVMGWGIEPIVRYATASVLTILEAYPYTNLYVMQVKPHGNPRPGLGQGDSGGPVVCDGFVYGVLTGLDPPTCYDQPLPNCIGLYNVINRENLQFVLNTTGLNLKKMVDEKLSTSTISSYISSTHHRSSTSTISITAYHRNSRSLQFLPFNMYSYLIVLILLELVKNIQWKY